MNLNAIQNLGQRGLVFCQSTGLSLLFLLKVIFRRPRLGRLLPLIIEQIYFVGVLSLIIIVVSG